jgi:hypothetical protein
MIIPIYCGKIKLNHQPALLGLPNQSPKLSVPPQSGIATASDGFLCCPVQRHGKPQGIIQTLSEFQHY